ncbi:cytoplasmic protein [Cryptococcus wingfieldii CBS 7118]|uniref:Cytoplasmic protein n=1 Tax=Cryptococcus wingfieldii CBS 7118 TaxID=1295528 RepID=A0A1E3K3K7_9TREE|nr:cytoplasmic protein [Cryptococcus wingfieldii CBS 7118]ODO07655.1 cytoplasmic protein [Cryptococcus wingfieldii CBS 7118]
MQAHRQQHATPPPLPRLNTRSYSSSTASTTHSALLPPPSPLGAPASIGMGQRSVSNASSASGFGLTDEIDRLSYLYSLRTAVLHHHLLSPNPGTPKPSSIRSNSSSRDPPLPSPPLTGTSPNGSRFTSFSFHSAPSYNTAPKLPDTPTTPTTPPPNLRRKSSAWTLGKGHKPEGEGSKLPKEFLLEFWGILGGEEGDQGWKTAVGAFLGMIKKGTKTPSGLNLREIPTILEAFTSNIPPPSPTCAPQHTHQSHLLQLLYNTLPRSSHFSPMSRAQTDKDRELLSRLRSEVQSYMLAPSPNPAGDGASSNLTTPVATTPKKSPVGLGRPSAQSVDAVRRKPSPIWDGDVNEMINTVGQVWGVRRDVMDRDILDIKSHGKSVELLYMNDLKRALTAISSQPPPLTSSQKSRQAYLSQAFTNIYNDFPSLNAPSDPSEYASPARDVPGGGAGFFFIPSRTVEVFGRLASRCAEAGHSARTRDLLERCREVWGISSRREKEKELEGLVGRWGDSIGTSDEIPLSRTIADGLKLISSDLKAGDPLPSVMIQYLHILLSLTTSNLLTIFPSSRPPPPPPPSLLILFNAAPRLFASQEDSRKTLSDAQDELVGAAIGEYIGAVEEYMGGVGGGENKGLVEGLEKVAKWMEKEVRGVKKAWGRGLESALNPAAIILSRQLPLFLAELQALSHPSPSGQASDIFPLYETTGKLLELWEDLVRDKEHDFELDVFFEPFVRGWLKETEGSEVEGWVARSVGMDSWVPEGENKHSQSVIDLFDFIRGSASIILHDLPLSEYKRAIYLIDYSKTVSFAVNQYASTVLALFVHDINPERSLSPSAEPAYQGMLSGKASSWLAKGQQAVKSLEKKKVDGFVVPPAACVKLTDMGAAKTCLEDLTFALEAAHTARIVKSHHLDTPHTERNVNHVFTVTVVRGQGLLGRGLKGGADAFVVVLDKGTGERRIKTKTILGAEDPKWEQAFEITVGAIKFLELQVFDRQLVGKHEPLGTASFKLDPRSFTSTPTRDIVLPLSPRGTIHIRISMEGGEKNDVQYHLDVAGRALDRAEGDMRRGIVEKMGEFIKAQLSVGTIQALMRPLKDKKRGKVPLSDDEIETSLLPLYDYLNDTFSIFSVTLTFDSRIRLMLYIWHRIIETLISLLVPPLSEKPSHAQPLTSPEVDIVFKWLQIIKAFFNASENGVEHGVPLSQLQAGPYRDIVMLGQYLDLPTPSLKERCSAAVRAAGKTGGSAGRIEDGMRGMALDEGQEGERMAEVLLRIARTRPDTGDFLAHEIGLLTKARVEKQAGVL